jgi:DNA-binding transcriptional LysR family regulator
MVQPSKQAARGILFEPLRTYPIVVAVPPGHAFARKRSRSVSLKEVLGEPLVTYSRKEFPDYHEMLARTAGPLARRLRIAEECDGVLSLIAAIESGKGVAVTAASLANTAGPRLCYVTLTPSPAPAVVGVAYRTAGAGPRQQLFLAAVASIKRDQRR